MTFKEIKRILKKKCVGIAGAGGLGSNCAVALARVGVGKIIIADFDKITKENLNRQYYFFDQIGQKKVFALADNIDFINPNVKIVPHDIKLNSANMLTIFEQCDVLIEAFDDAEMKHMLIETVQSVWPDKPLIIGSGMAGWGDTTSIKARQIDNLYICGDEKSEISNELPPLAPRVGIVANMQANIALEILLS